MLDVAGTRVDALHVVHDVAVSGPSTGAHHVESWYRRSDGLVLREVVTISTVQDTPVRRSAFEERSTIELLTPTPAV